MEDTKQLRNVVKSIDVLKKKFNMEVSDEGLYAIGQWEAKRNEVLRKIAEYPLDVPIRIRLNDERRSLIHHFKIGTKKQGDVFSRVSGYLVCGLYGNNKLGEIFIVINKQGSFISGMTDALATAISIGLQHGIPLEVFTHKFKHTSFYPAGIVQGAPDKDLKIASSLLDYLSRWLEKKFPGGKLSEEKIKSVCTF